MGSKQRYVVECTWGGYRPGQEHVVHREVTTYPHRYERVAGIVFGDGTTMYVSVRPCKPRERVKPIMGYREAMDRVCWSKDISGMVRIEDLFPARKSEAAK